MPTKHVASHKPNKQEFHRNITGILGKKQRNTGKRICVEIRSALREKRRCSTHAEQVKVGEIKQNSGMERRSDRRESTNLINPICL